jgi:hypothetical protein
MLQQTVRMRPGHTNRCWFLIRRKDNNPFHISCTPRPVQMKPVRFQGSIKGLFFGGPSSSALRVSFCGVTLAFGLLD